MIVQGRFIAVLNLMSHVTDLAKQTYGFVDSMTNNTYFATPTPTLASVKAAADAVVAAEIAARNKAPGAIEDRNQKVIALISLLHALRAYVQSIADSDISNGEAIIRSSGMGVKKVTPRQKNTFKATQGDVSGLVLLTAPRAAAKACYTWQWSTDEKVWTTLPQTMVATTTVSGLTPATVYYFRYRVRTRKGESDWSQIISILVK
jgi:hypothetical protein